MARAFQPKVATANDLLDGDVVYFTHTGTWSRRHRDAVVAETEEQADTLLSAAQQFQNDVVGVYLADARADATGQPEPVHFREVFRTRGPSNYFHGKQADLAEDA